MEEILLNALTKAIEKKNELELQYIIAEQEYEALLRAYKAYKGGK